MMITLPHSLQKYQGRAPSEIERNRYIEMREREIDIQKREREKQIDRRERKIDRQMMIALPHSLQKYQGRAPPEIERKIYRNERNKQIYRRKRNRQIDR